MSLADRFDALGRTAHILWPYLEPGPDADAVGAAGELADRAAARLHLSGEHTVVALAGATGTGKSSLFNALARMELSPTGHLRPTTAMPHACVWGGGDASALLDWLGVATSFRRESALDAQDEAGLRGLVLVDLPDMDSVAAGNRVEADRLVSIVDLVIWVLDPQKYADQTVHEDYLRHMGALRDVTVVVFNQIDRLSQSDADRCRDDLARLVEADGLAGVPVLATSARTGAGVEEIRTLLEKAVSGRHAALARLEGELDEALSALAPLVERSGVHDDVLDRETVRAFGDDLAAAAGVAAVADEAARGYARWARLPVRESAVPTAEPRIDPAEVRLATRRLALRAGAGLVGGWPDRLQAVAASGVDTITDSLRVAVDRAGRDRATGGWLFAARALFWIGVVALLAGAAALVVDAVRGRAGPGGYGWPLGVLVGGAVLAAAVLVLGRLLARVGARRARARAERGLREASISVAREAVGPIRAVLRDLLDAQVAYAHARTDHVVR